MEPITLALGLAKFLGPKIVKLVAGDKSGKVAEEVIGHAMAVTGQSTPDKAAAALEANPELQLQLKSRLMDHIESLERLANEDRADARDRDIELRRQGYNNRRADWMVFADVAGLIACLVAISVIAYFQMKGEIDASSNAMTSLITLLSTIAGFFGLSLRDAHQFEFGSSRGSKDKDNRPSFNLPTR